MERFEIEVQATRPVFCRGADEAAAELRAPSLKGLLRWWYRAFHPDAVRGPITSAWIEPRIMGGTPPWGQSPFLLRVEVERVEVDKKPKLVRWNEIRPPDLNYLGFAFRETRDPKGHRALVEGTEFKAVHHFPRPVTDEQAKGLIAAWWLLAHFGGLGARSRRGFGSLAIRTWSWPEQEALLAALPLAWAAADKARWSEGLGRGLAALASWRAEAAWLPDYPHPHFGEATRLVTMGEWGNAAGAQAEGGRMLKEGRREQKRAFEQDGRAAFGLPFKGKQLARGGSEPFERGEGNRFASPLHLHVAAFAEGKRFGLCWLRLDGAVPGRGALRLQGQGEEMPDVLGGFMRGLEAGNDKGRVVGSWAP